MPFGHCLKTLQLEGTTFQEKRVLKTSNKIYEKKRKTDRIQNKISLLKEMSVMIIPQGVLASCHLI